MRQIVSGHAAVEVELIIWFCESKSSLHLQEVLSHYEPRASTVPANLDFTQCPFMWPFCKQPIYAHAMPLMFNATVLNGMGLTGLCSPPPPPFPTHA